MKTWMEQHRTMRPPSLVEEERGRAETATEKEVGMEQGGAAGAPAVVIIAKVTLLVMDPALTALCTV